jgi:hypothetical protein
LKHFSNVIVCLIGALCTLAAFAETEEAKTSSASPVAYVYVSRPTHIDGFAAASDGKLTPVPGSPFLGDVAGMAINGEYLYGSGTDMTNIYSFSVASDGALKPAAVTNSNKYNSSGCGGLGPTLLDHTGKYLYTGVSVGGSGPGFDCPESAFQSWAMEKTGGELKYLGSNGYLFLFYGRLSFSGNNKFAYGASCSYAGGGGDQYIGQIAGFERHSNGFLTSGIDGPIPATEESGDFYCAEASSSDPSNHLAVAMQPNNLDTTNFDGPSQLATYTEDEHGGLTTKSTYKNMPATEVGGVNDMEMSPSGKLLAVGGQGFQIFHFNGSEPITKYSGLLQSGIQFQQFAWDGANHLYALGGGKLFVYEVTTTTIKQSPGSPYLIPESSSVTVRVLK